MPHATAAWLVDNTSLAFTQIAEFCGLHILEIQAIADDTAATKLTGRDPIRANELTHEEIEKSGATTAQELLQLIGSNASVGSVLASSTIGATHLSAQAANRRGLHGRRPQAALTARRLEGHARPGDRRPGARRV